MTTSFETRQMVNARLYAERAEAIRRGNELLNRLSPHKTDFPIYSLAQLGSVTTRRQITKWTSKSSGE